MAETRAPKFGWGRVADYLFGRNALIGVASFMLLFISGYATWHGMRDFIIGVSSTPTSQGQTLPGGMSISNDALVIAVVVALTFLMWLMLRETFGAKRHLRERLVTFPLYVFLAVWSIGFGYGFWWSLISGEEATRTGPRRPAGGRARRQRRGRRAARCGARAARQRGELVRRPDDARGDQRRQLRHALGRRPRPALQCTPQRARFHQYPARGHDAVLVRRPCRPTSSSSSRARPRSAVSPSRSGRRRFEARASDIRGRARNIAARSNQLGQSTAAEMRAIANAVAVAPGAAGFSCYDPTLAERLRQAAAQAEQPAELQLREAVFNEGPAGVANAVKNLWRNIGAYASSLPAYVLSGAADGRPHRQRRADHRPRPDRAAGHHRHRPGAAGAGDPQPAAGAAVDPPVRRAQPPDQGGDRHGHCPLGRRPRMGAPPFRASQQGVVSGDPQPLRLRFRQQGGVRQGARHEPAGGCAERSGVGALAEHPRSCRKELTQGRNHRQRHRPHRDPQEMVRGEGPGRREGRASARRSADPQPRPVLQGGARARDRRLERGCARDVEIFRLVDTDGLTPAAHGPQRGAPRTRQRDARPRPSPSRGLTGAATRVSLRTPSSWVGSSLRSTQPTTPSPGLTRAFTATLV